MADNGEEPLGDKSEYIDPDAVPELAPEHQLEKGRKHDLSPVAAPEEPALSENDSEQAQREDQYYEEYQEWLRQQENSRTVTAAQLFNRPPNKINAYCPKFAIPGALTIVAGEPKVGKTTFLLYLLDAVTRGESFLGEDCSKTNALYASEQNSTVFREQLLKIPSLAKNSKLHIIPLERNCELEEDGFSEEPNSYGLPLYRIRLFANWSEQVEFWRNQIIQTHARILIVDTLVSFANLESDEVNDPGTMTRLLMNLKSLFKTRSDLAIVVLHHLRKTKSNNSIRSFNDIAGSYALRAATDQNVLIYASHPTQHPTRRRILLEGRFSPAETVDIHLDDSGYHRLAGEPERKQQTAAKDPQEIILNALQASPNLDLLGNKSLASKIGISEHQVQVFRENHPKGSFAKG